MLIKGMTMLENPPSYYFLFEHKMYVSLVHSITTVICLVGRLFDLLNLANQPGNPDPHSLTSSQIFEVAVKTGLYLHTPTLAHVHMHTFTLFFGRLRLEMIHLKNIQIPPVFGELVGAAHACEVKSLPRVHVCTRARTKRTGWRVAGAARTRFIISSSTSYAKRVHVCPEVDSGGRGALVCGSACAFGVPDMRERERERERFECACK